MSLYYSTKTKGAKRCTLCGRDYGLLLFRAGDGPEIVACHACRNAIAQYHLASRSAEDTCQD